MGNLQKHLGVLILPWLAVLMPKWVRLAARFPVLLELLRAGKVDSSGSSGVGRGEGKWMFVRSGREPPVLCVAGISVVVFSWSAEGKMLNKGERGGKKKKTFQFKFQPGQIFIKYFLKRKMPYSELYIVFLISQRCNSQWFTHKRFWLALYLLQC